MTEIFSDTVPPEPATAERTETPGTDLFCSIPVPLCVTHNGHVFYFKLLFLGLNKSSRTVVLRVESDFSLTYANKPMNEYSESLHPQVFPLLKY